MNAYGRNRPVKKTSSPQRGSSGRRSSPLTIAELVAVAVQQSGVGQNTVLSKLRHAWEEAVGRATAAKSRVTGFRNNVLLVEVDSAALGQELSVYHKAALIKRLREVTKVGLTDLRCKVGGSPTRRPGASSPGESMV